MSAGTAGLNIRRLVMDVDKAVARPAIPDIAAAIGACDGVAGINITVGEIDIETVGMDVIVEGERLDYAQIVRAIEQTGAVVHSLDQIVCGERVVEAVARKR
ncbi:DUF211 domain-containing protein [Fulvimonas soli]|jgi:hypothetical protein|uniref:DUF211 domain-containing protein n=1 Tax=Fulvimonas soli TaxID=155197 RepID=A0A316IRL2_9GAMM|nr:DUF211 domain-containing protein [Fulvimonas soli]PWK89741.1 hypothetical protein C7456_10490 [Fulvimonas soli]TNY27613.1 hypothetical protein BV497_02820 [Fulvimonas soli]